MDKASSRMLAGWAIVVLAIGYVGCLFAIAWVGDRSIRSTKGGRGRPVIYALSLGVYCTSWTFFGSVGLASATGYDFVPVYLGPILIFALGWRVIVRIVRVAKSQNLTSVADFIAARYGKSQAVSAIVTLVAVVGTLPYIALQLKAIVSSTETLLGGNPLVSNSLPELGFVETALVVAIALATFAVLFGTRHIDATEHQDGLMLAIAAESLIKLVAFLTVGVFVMVTVFGDVGGFYARVRDSYEVQSTFGRAFNGGTWLTVTCLSMVAIILLPRQFHVTVVENNSEAEIRRAAWLFPTYLVLINLFVVPIAMGGLLVLPKTFVNPDMFVLALPMAKGADVVATIAYIGGLSAATAMVIVESIALAIMVCNGLVTPLLLRNRILESQASEAFVRTLLIVRRVAIFAIILLGFAVHRLLGPVHALAAIGLLSFAAIAQLAPAFFGGLIWRKGTARGAIAGILTGFAVWAYTLLLPWLVNAKWLAESVLTAGPFDIGFLRPQALFYLDFDPLTHGVLWSLGANIAAYITVSLLRAPEPIERLQAHVFVQDEAPRVSSAPTFRLWRTSITIGDLQATVARYLGVERASRSFSEYAATRDTTLVLHGEADLHALRFTEHLLTSAIGAASARLVMSLLLRRNNVGSQSALRLLDDATEALQYNRDLLQSAIDQVRHGISVFDKDLQLICWNRQFRELLQLPVELGRVGVPLDRVLRACAERGDFGGGNIEALVTDRVRKLAVAHETFQEHFQHGSRILEIRTAPMPQGGIVTTYADITERVRAADELARANETLERRVRERTAELLEVNAALAVAKHKADEANLDKTRFLAAASHDLLQPLNAARLYSSSLVERHLPASEARIASNIDASLSSVEEILGALIDLSRMDAGRLEPEYNEFPLEDLFQQLKLEFEPVAREKGLELRVLTTSVWVRSDRRLLRRVLQNLVSNAIKYTVTGRAIMGVRRRGDRVTIMVCDSGRGIPADKHALIFKEFQRLDDPGHAVRGLGLGLSIVERIGRVLAAPIGVRSLPGRGSAFSITLPRSAAKSQPSVKDGQVVPVGLIAGLRVLCIDNEPAVIEGMSTLLEGWGCEVVAATSLEGALQALVARGRSIDVIVADYHLDQGTGVEAIAAVRRRFGASIPAIVVTADHSPEVQRSLKELGLSQLRKPVKAGSLRALITAKAVRRGIAAE
jgi:Na+/proline symporter/CheY-like chemotaxis protein